jgi:hypothetical protein
MILSLAQRVLGALGSRPLLILVLALCALSGWLLHSKGRAIDQRDEAREALAVQIEKYRAAYDMAVELHTAAKQAEDGRLKALKEKTDAVSAARRAGADAAAADYFDRHRLRPEARADPGASGSGHLPGATTLAEGAEDQAGDAELAAISRSDLDTCTTNSLDLLSAYEWGAGL